MFENIDWFEILVGLSMLWLTWLIITVIDINAELNDEDKNDANL